jgi:hypothetical protein
MVSISSHRKGGKTIVLTTQNKGGPWRDAVMALLSIDVDVDVEDYLNVTGKLECHRKRTTNNGQQCKLRSGSVDFQNSTLLVPGTNMHISPSLYTI